MVDDHDHHHEHAHDERRALQLGARAVELRVFEQGVPPRFRLKARGRRRLDASAVESTRADSDRAEFRFRDRGGFIESS